MRKLIIGLMFFSLLGGASLSFAQDEPGKEASAPANVEKVDKTDDGGTAKALRQEIKATRKEIREKNSQLAESLAKTNDYDEKEVRAKHTELTDTHKKLFELELEEILLYKKNNPDWRPDANGNKITPQTKKGQKKQSDSVGATDDATPAGETKTVDDGKAVKTKKGKKAAAE